LDNNSLYTDKQLFTRIAEGSHPAFTALLDRYHARIYNRAMLFVKDAFKAQDIVQDVFISIWNARHALDKVDNPEHYLLVVARNRIVAEFKRKFAYSSLDEADAAQPMNNQSILHQLESKQLMTLIDTAVDQLPPQQKRVFEFAKKEGLKYDEIAEKLNISPNTVKVHMVQALSFIRYFVRNESLILLCILLS